jgi:hypothetical protein
MSRTIKIIFMNDTIKTFEMQLDISHELFIHHLKELDRHIGAMESSIEIAKSHPLLADKVRPLETGLFALLTERKRLRHSLKNSESSLTEAIEVALTKQKETMISEVEKQNSAMIDIFRWMMGLDGPFTSNKTNKRQKSGRAMGAFWWRAPLLEKLSSAGIVLFK